MVMTPRHHGDDTFAKTTPPPLAAIDVTPRAYRSGMDFGTRLHRLLDDVLGQDPRRALIAYRELANEHLPWLELRVVALGKREGWSLARMGRLLGLTRQTMHRRFRTIRPALPYDPDVDQQAFNRRFRHLTDRSRRQPDSSEEVVPW